MQRRSTFHDFTALKTANGTIRLHRTAKDTGITVFERIVDRSLGQLLIAGCEVAKELSKFTRLHNTFFIIMHDESLPWIAVQTSTPQFHHIMKRPGFKFCAVGRLVMLRWGKYKYLYWNRGLSEIVFQGVPLLM